MDNRLLRDLKVLELAGVLAGPAVGMFFAELGARVIKVENARMGGDLTRKWKLPVEDPEAPASAYYHSVNWNKEILQLDLSRPDELQQVFDLLSDTDVVITNFRSDAAQRLGLDSGSLKTRFPGLIIAEVRGYADSDRVAYDAVLQAESGFMAMNGEPDGSPLKMPVALIDLLAAHQLKEAVLLALLHRTRTGKGSVVSASLYESAVASLANQASAWLNCAYESGRMGSLHPSIAPYGEVFTCQDNRQLLLAIGTDEQFRRMVTAMNQPDFADDPRFATNPERVRHRVELAELLTPLFRGRDMDYWLSLFNADKIPVGPIRTLREVFDTASARSMVITQQEPDGSQSYRVSTVAFRIEPN